MATLARGESRERAWRLARELASVVGARVDRLRRGGRGGALLRLGRRPSGPYRRPPIEAVLRSPQGGQPVGEVEIGRGPSDCRPRAAWRRAGVAVVERAKADGSWAIFESVDRLEVPADLADALAARSPAREAWDAYPRSVRHAALSWVVLARRAETRAKRIAVIADAAERGDGPIGPPGSQQRVRQPLAIGGRLATRRVPARPASGSFGDPGSAPRDGPRVHWRDGFGPLGRRCKDGIDAARRCRDRD